MRYTLSVVVIIAAAAPAIAQDMPLYGDVLIEGEGWKPFCKFESIGGLAVNAKGKVSVADPLGNMAHSYHILAQKTVSEELRLPDGPATLCWEKDSDDIIVCFPASKKIIRFPNKPTANKVVIAEFAANGIVESAKGFYATVSSEGAVYFIDGKDKPRKVAEGLKDPTGLTLWPDGGTLVVAEAHGLKLQTYRVEKDGSLTCREGYYTLRKPSGTAVLEVGGLTVDDRGRLYAATSIGVQVFDPIGRMCGVLLKPKDAPITAIALGGAKGDTLFVACGDEVFSRTIKGRGVPWREKAK
jgi:gluconolactonase